MKKTILNVLGACVVISILALGLSSNGRSAISELVGLSVAESTTLWNNVKDASRGDGLTNGIMAQSTYLFNGLTFDRLRSVPATDANAGTGMLAMVSMLYNGATYDRIRGGLTSDANAATGIIDTAMLMYNGATWDRIRGSTTNGILTEKKTVGTAFYSIKRDNITTSSVNLAFGLTSRKISIEVPMTNTDEMCVDWIGGTAVCPAANTAGDGRLAPGTSILLDDFAGTSISVIAASGTQSVFVRAWN
jgi:hypothetical protein